MRLCVDGEISGTFPQLSLGIVRGRIDARKAHLHEVDEGIGVKTKRYPPAHEALARRSLRPSHGRPSGQLFGLKYPCQHMDSAMEYEIQDLSLRLPENGLAFPGDVRVTVEGPYSYVNGDAREFCYSLMMSTQAGTHIQGAHYFKEGGRPIYGYPLSRFEGPIFLVDCMHDRFIDRQVLMEKLPPGDLADRVVIFRTGFIDRLLEIWRQREGEITFEDLNGKPGLTLDAAELLLERNVKLLGIDSTGFELYPTDSHSVNRLLCNNDVLLLENLCRLESLPQEGAWLECFPLPLERVEGTPCRAIAKIPVCEARP